MSTDFSRGEAEALIGRSFETLVDLPDAPKGARGTVVGIDPQDQRGLIVIRWEQNVARRGPHMPHTWHGSSLRCSRAARMERVE